eukprot:3877530-Alexandrium_andersonii.AAC.1
MSASLVGSEMCIRDRTTAATTQQRWEQHQQQQHQLNRGCNSCTTATVSYTHLTLPTICSV